MSITMLFEQLVTTPHHIVDLTSFLKEFHPAIQQAFSNNDATLLKDFFNESRVLADRTTICDL